MLMTENGIQMEDERKCFKKEICQGWDSGTIARKRTTAIPPMETVRKAEVNRSWPHTGGKEIPGKLGQTRAYRPRTVTIHAIMVEKVE